MWILSFLPNAIFHWIVGLGVLAILSSIFLAFIPLVRQYKIPVKYAGIALLAIGIFFEGAIFDNEAWVARVKEMEAKVAKAEEESKEANAKIDAKVNNRVTQLVEKRRVIKQYIDREIVKYDNTCNIPNEFIEAHNKAAKK
jgi:type VI protein secretion system component VasK